MRMGIIRFILALGVLLSHMQHQIMPAAGALVDYRLTLGIFGGYSVLWFYVVSGFLMSTVLSQKYAANVDGTLQFFKSRFLRIYPLWWVIFLFCSFFVVQGQVPLWSSSHSIRDYVQGLALYGQDWRLIFSTYPNANWEIFPTGSDVGWTLSAELTFYLLAPFVLRSIRWSLALFAVSAAIRIAVCIFTDPNSHLHITWNYFFFPSTLCFFLLGHLGRVVSEKLRVATPIGYAFLTLSFVLSLKLAKPHSFDNPLVYFSIVFFALGLPTLFKTTKDNRISNFFGDLTYPLYLVGNICLNAILAVWSGVGDYGMWVIRVAESFQSPHTKGLVITFLVLLFVLPVAIFVHFVVERTAIFIVRSGMDAVARGVERGWPSAAKSASVSAPSP